MILQEEDIGVDLILPERTADTGTRIEAETDIIIGGLHLVIESPKWKRVVAGWKPTGRSVRFMAGKTRTTIRIRGSWRSWLTSSVARTDKGRLLRRMRRKCLQQPPQFMIGLRGRGLRVEGPSQGRRASIRWGRGLVRVRKRALIGLEEKDQRRWTHDKYNQEDDEEDSRSDRSARARQWWFN